MDNHSWTASCRMAGQYLLVITLMAATGAAAIGAEPVAKTAVDDFPDLPALDAEELRALRGGFEYAGMKFDFSAQLRTFVDGRLALETLITYTRNGAITQHRPMPAPGPATQAAPSSTTHPSPVAAESVEVPGPDQDRTPAQLNLPGVDLAGMKNAAGVLIDDRRGAILALHEATRERITSMVVNQASGRDIRQEMNVNVTVQNFQQFRDTLRSTILNSRMSASPR